MFGVEQDDAAESQCSYHLPVLEVNDAPSLFFSFIFFVVVVCFAYEHIYLYGVVRTEKKKTFMSNSQHLTCRIVAGKQWANTAVYSQSIISDTGMEKILLLHTLQPNTSTITVQHIIQV